MKFPSPNQVIFHFQKALGSNYSLCTVNYLQIFIWIAGPRKAEPFWPRLTLNKPQILGLVSSRHLVPGSFSCFAWLFTLVLNIRG